MSYLLNNFKKFAQEVPCEKRLGIIFSLFFNIPRCCLPFALSVSRIIDEERGKRYASPIIKPVFSNRSERQPRRCSSVRGMITSGNGARRSVNDHRSFNSKNARQAPTTPRPLLPLLFSAARARLPPFHSSFIHGQTAALLARLYWLWTLNAPPVLFNVCPINRPGNYFSSDFTGL